MDSNTRELIEAGLAVYTPKCPCCNKRILTSKRVGQLVINSHDYLENGTRSIRPYLICKGCLPKFSIPSVTRRILRRLEKDFMQYVLPIQWRGMRSPQPMILRSGNTGPWKEDDRTWFEQSPMRSFRLRRAFAEEPDIGTADWVIICQTEPGRRVRIPWEPPFSGSGIDELIKTLQGDDESLWLIFDEFTGGQMHHTGGEA